ELRALIALLRRAAERPTALTLRARADLDVHANLLLGLLEPDSVASTARASQYPAATEIDRWSASEANRPAGQEGLQHAVIESCSACGIPRRALVIWQHRFHPARLDACPK